MSKKTEKAIAKREAAKAKQFKRAKPTDVADSEDETEDDAEDQDEDAAQGNA